jgi:hypothetical protein
MPLRDHFHPPFSKKHRWDGFLGAWPTIIVADLNKRLPLRYTAAPTIHLGAEFEIDIAAYEEEDRSASAFETEGSVGTATALWAPPKPTLTLDVDLEDQDEYEVLIHDRDRRLVAAIEIVSPSNKDRPDRRRAFAMKCAAMMQQGVSVSIVDLVTVRGSNLYLETLDLLEKSDPHFSTDSSMIYATSCRWRTENEHWKLDTWAHPLNVGQPLPTLPIWLAYDLAVPLELEQTYEETCRVLRIS